MGGIFFGGIFWEKFFGRTFWEDFREDFFGRNSLYIGIDLFIKILVFVKILSKSKEGRKEILDP